MMMISMMLMIRLSKIRILLQENIYFECSILVYHQHQVQLIFNKVRILIKRFQKRIRQLTNQQTEICKKKAKLIDNREKILKFRRTNNSQIPFEIYESAYEEEPEEERKNSIST